MVCIIYCLKHNKLAGSESIKKKTGNSCLAPGNSWCDTISKYSVGQIVTLVQTLPLLWLARVFTISNSISFTRARQFTSHWELNVSVSPFKELENQWNDILKTYVVTLCLFLSCTHMSKQNAISFQEIHGKKSVKLT